MIGGLHVERARFIGFTVIGFMVRVTGLRVRVRVVKISQRTPLMQRRTVRLSPTIRVSTMACLVKTMNRISAG